MEPIAYDVLLAYSNIEYNQIEFVANHAFSESQIAKL